MSYSIIGIIAIVIHLIINRDMLWRSSDNHFVPAQKEHRQYIYNYVKKVYKKLLCKKAQQTAVLK